MDKAVSIDLNTNVEVGEEHIIVPGDKASFREKNTETYKGLLSNMTEDSGDGWMTTTNKKVELISDDGTVAILDVNGKRLSIPSSMKLVASYHIDSNIAGDITSIVSDGVKAYYILRDRLNNVYKVEKVLTTGAESEVLLGNGDEKTFNAFFMLESTNYVVSTGTNFKIYSIDGTELVSVDVSSGRAFNNGWYQDENNWAVGRDDNDQYYARSHAVYSGTSYDFKYMGCVDQNGNITGEPFPANSVSSMTIGYSTPERLTNGILRWTRWNMNEVLCYPESSSYGRMTSGEWRANRPRFSRLEWVSGSGHEPVYNEVWPDTDLNYWVLMITPTSVKYVTRDAQPVTPSNRSYFTTRWIATDPGANPGPVWEVSSYGEYDNRFPMKYFYTNKQANRGKTFIYGRGFVRSYVVNGGVYSFRGGTDQGTPPNYSYIFHPYSAQTYIAEITNGGSIKKRYLDAHASFSVSFVSDVPMPVKSDQGEDDSELIDSTVYYGNMRVHPITPDQLENKSWSEWLWTIGGPNTGNSAFLTDIPHYVKYGNFSVLGYNGYTIGFSYNKVLINTPSKEIEVWSVYEHDGNVIISTSENVYVLGPGAFKLRKVADFIFATNCITEYNTLQENRDGVIRLIRAFIPYNMSYELNSQWSNFTFLCPEDGSAANASWLTGAAVNANLKDDYLAASFLLPAINIPMYIASTDLDSFNKFIIDANLPILVPTKNDLLFDDEELLVYYTHSQLSTDIIYRETEKGSDSYFNPDYEENNWWLTSTTIEFPVGIAARLSGINYMSSTVSLEGDYTARLHVENNQAYLVYNIAEQVYYGGTIFTIYTNNYYYDGEAIYSIVSGSNAEFVCYAIGLRFLGNSGTEAYFYSPYDKSIYLFSGSNTLTKARSLSYMANIKDSMFSSVNQRMYLLDESSNVLWLSNESSGLYRLEDIDHLESSEKGAIFVGDGKYSIYSPRGDYEKLVPIEIETSWIGDNTSLNKFGYGEIQLYSPEPVAATIKISTYVKDGVDIKSTEKTVNVKKSDWKGTYLRIRATPESATGQAFKIKVSSDDLVHIMNIAFAFEQVSKVPAASVAEISV